MIFLPEILLQPLPMHGTLTLPCPMQSALRDAHA